MKKLIDLLRKQPLPSVQHALVLSVYSGDYRIVVRLESGMKRTVRYNTSIATPSIGDRVVIVGERVQSVVQRDDKSIPKNTVILKV